MTKILVAEDDVVSRKLIRNVLEKQGHDVIAVEDGTSAWEMIQTFNIRMLISDWMMPGISGPDLCRRIRKRSSGSYVYIILLTVKNDPTNIIRGLCSGADDYLTKPFNHAEFTARLNSGLRILKLEDSLQQANDEIRMLSLTDPLTGCYNRRYLEVQLPREINRCRRCKHPLSIAMCDIDHFKWINDLWGHPVGDTVLQEFAERLRVFIRRDVDWIVRYGGEEFLVVFPETPAPRAPVLSERLRQAICGRPFFIAGQELNVTASFGVAGVDSEAMTDKVTMATLVGQADDMLYRSKRNGRNQTSWQQMVG